MRLPGWVGGVATCSILALLNFASLSLGFLTSAPGLEATLSTGHFHPHSLPFPDFSVVEKRSLGFQDSPAAAGQGSGAPPGEGSAPRAELGRGRAAEAAPQVTPWGNPCSPAPALAPAPPLRRPSVPTSSSPAPLLPPAGVLPRKLYACTKARLP